MREGTVPEGSEEPAPDPPGSVTGNSIAHATWTTVSRITGVGRVVAIGAVLGTTYFGNTFLATNLVPNLTYELLTGSLFTSLLVPPLVRRVDARNPTGTARLAGGFLGVALAVFLVVILAVVLAGPLVLRALSLGVTDPAIADAQRRVGWILLALLMPQVALYGIAGTAGAVLNAHGRFALPAAAPVLENVGVVATLLVHAWWYGSGVDLLEVSTGQLLLLGIGTTTAVGLHAGALWLGARRVGVTLVPRAGWRDPEVRSIVARAVPSLGYAGLNAVRQFGALVVANRVPGGVVAFQLALNFYHLPVAVGARPIAVALLPPLARQHDRGDDESFSTLFSRGLSLVCLLTVPAAMAYVVFATPLAEAIAFGEMARGQGTALLSGALVGLALGVVGEGVFIMSTNGSYAKRDARSPFVGMMWRTLISVTGMTATFFLLPGEVAVMLGLGTAMTVGNLLSAWQLTRRVGGAQWRSIWAAIGRTILASLCMIPPAYLTWRLMAGWSGSELVGVAVAAILGVMVFVMALVAIRSSDLAFLVGDLRASNRPRLATGDGR